MQGNGYLFFPEPFCRVLHQLRAVLLGKVQDGPLGAGIQDLLHILLPLYISSRDHGDPYDPVHPFHQVDGFIMLLV